MSAHYLKRVATVVSLKQLRDDAVASAGGAEPAELDDGLGPMAPVAQVAGSRLPRYCYAVEAPPKTLAQRARARAEALAAARAAEGDSGDSSDSAMSMGATSPGGGAAGAAAGALEDDAASTVASTVGSVLDLSVLAEVPQRSLLDTVTLALWEQCADERLFRYDVTACPTRVLAGQYGFVAQLNEGRATQKRATEFRMDQVCQPFDASKFNFKKAYVREVLYQFAPAAAPAAAAAGGGAPARFEELAPVPASPNLVVINVSPIEYGHVLLCPRVLDDLPQLVDAPSAALALRFAREAANPYLRVGYNSFGAFASINHLHFQAYYLAAPLPIERAPTVPLLGVRGLRRRDGVRVARTADYPVRAFVVEGADVDAVAGALGDACAALQRANVPHNFIICDSGMRTFVFPQRFAERLAANAVPEDLLDTGINPAVFEIAGHMLIKRPADYEAFNEALAWRLLAEASLPEERFLELAGACFGEQPAEPAELAGAGAGAAGAGARVLAAV